jgi:hypothetical protein
MSALISILFAITLLSGCGNDDFRKVERLEGFRVLAIAATNPELPLSGGTVDLTLHLFHENFGSSITGAWQVCLDPGVTRGALPSCEGTSNPISITNSALYATHGISNVPVPNVNEQAHSARDKFNGIAYLVIFNLQVDGQQVSFFKRLIRTERTPPNTNPGIGGLTVNGSTPSGPLVAGDAVDVSLVSGAETYQFIQFDGSLVQRQERLSIAWYTTVGEFNRPKASPGERVVYQGDTGPGPELLIAVVRDERGGVAVSAVTLP